MLKPTSTLLLFATALVPTAIPSVAHAIAVAAEVGPQIRLTESPVADDGSVGFGFAGRIGFPIKIPLLKITPELKVAYDSLPLLGGDFNIVRFAGGARVTLLEGFSPIAFAHAGYGSCEGDGCGGLTIDVGAGLDFTLLPIVDVGVFLAWNTLRDDGGSFEWLSLGAQASLSF